MTFPFSGNFSDYSLILNVSGKWGQERIRGELENTVEIEEMRQKVLFVGQLPHNVFLEHAVTKVKSSDLKLQGDRYGNL